MHVYCLCLFELMFQNLGPNQIVGIHVFLSYLMWIGQGEHVSHITYRLDFFFVGDHVTYKVTPVM